MQNPLFLKPLEDELDDELAEPQTRKLPLLEMVPPAPIPLGGPTYQEILDEVPRGGAKSPSLLGRLAITLAPLCGAFYDAQMKVRGVRLVRHRVQPNGYPAGAPTLRAVFLSDLHYGPASGRTAARQAWTLAREAEPDVLFLGGDFLWADQRGLPALIRELQRWKRNPPPGGIYAVLGNHDHRANRDALLLCLEACGVKVLLNDAMPLPHPWHHVWVAGVDDMDEGDPQPELTLAGVPQGACTIMLSHSPDVCDSPVLKRCALTLCGGTHGGQICPPNGEPLWMRSKWGKQYTAGLFRHAGNWVFVSRGVGVSHLPLRLWAPPDVGVLEIVGRPGTRR